MNFFFFSSVKVFLQSEKFITTSVVGSESRTEGSDCFRNEMNKIHQKLCSLAVKSSGTAITLAWVGVLTSPLAEPREDAVRGCYSPALVGRGSALSVSLISVKTSGVLLKLIIDKLKHRKGLLYR